MRRQQGRTWLVVVVAVVASAGLFYMFRHRAVGPAPQGTANPAGGSATSQGPEDPGGASGTVPSGESGSDGLDPGKPRLPAGGGSALTEAERAARETERNRWVNELRSRGTRWVEREAARLGLTEDQRALFATVAGETATELNAIRVGTGERDVETLVATLFEKGDARLLAVLTEEQAAKAMGLPRDWARDLVGETQ